MPDEIIQPQVEQPVPAASSDPLSGVADYFRSEGYEIPDGWSGKDIIGRLTEAASRGPDPQLQSYARAGQEYVQLQASPQWKQYQEWMNSQGKEAKKEPEQPKFKWEVPKFNPAWQQHVRMDPDTGAYIPANQYASAAAVAEANSYRQASEEHMRRLLNDFPSLVEEIVKPRFEELEQKKFDEWFEKRMSWRQMKEQAANYIQQNEQELYQRDQNGNPVLDQMGNPVVAPHGRLMQFYLNEGWDMLQKLTGPIKDNPTPDQWQWVQNYALLHTPRDVAAARQWQGYVSQMQQQAGAAAFPQPTQPEQAPPPPSPIERNAAIKERSIARATQRRRDNPGTNGSSRRVADAADSPDMPRSLKERILAKL